MPQYLPLIVTKSQCSVNRFLKILAEFFATICKKSEIALSLKPKARDTGEFSCVPRFAFCVSVGEKLGEN